MGSGEGRGVVGSVRGVHVFEAADGCEQLWRTAVVRIRIAATRSTFATRRRPTLTALPLPRRRAAQIEITDLHGGQLYRGSERIELIVYVIPIIDITLCFRSALLQVILLIPYLCFQKYAHKYMISQS